jgi:hypothetical protein
VLMEALGISGGEDDGAAHTARELAPSSPWMECSVPANWDGLPLGINAAITGRLLCR